MADRYRKGELSDAQARQQIGTITQSGQIPDATALRTVNDALSGAKLTSPEETPFDSVLEQGFKAFGVLAAPMFAIPSAALTISAVSAYGAPLVRYLTDPNNILTGQFAAPRPDPILLAGAAAMEQLNRLTRQHDDLVQIYQDIVPQEAARLRVGDPNAVQSLAASMGGELAASIQGLLAANEPEARRGR